MRVFGRRRVGTVNVIVEPTDVIVNDAVVLRLEPGDRVILRTAGSTPPARHESRKVLA